jgi:DNA mismatch repair ATPase MutL
MRVARFVSTSGLSLVLGIAGFISLQSSLYAQDQRDDTKPQEKQESRPDDAKPAQPDNAKKAQPDAAKPAQDDMKRNDDAKRTQAEPQPRQDSAKPAEQSEDKAVRTQDRPAAQQEADRPAQQADRGAQMNDHAQPAAGGNRIPDDKFRANFGRQHTFVVQRPVVVGGQPRFQYGGYSFILIDAWPADWAYTDQCYIDYIDGEYFLFDLVYPGVRLAIEVI